MPKRPRSRRRVAKENLLKAHKAAYAKREGFNSALSKKLPSAVSTSIKLNDCTLSDDKFLGEFESMQRWRNKVALVTGASCGIGAAICQKLCMAGMLVIGCSRNIENLNTLESELRAKGLNNFKKIVCDVGNPEQVRQLFATLRGDVGKLHVVVNNAGVLSHSPLLTADIQDFHTMMNVNVLGLTHVTQEAVRLMQECEAADAHVINVGSSSGHYISKCPATVFYSATKFAVRVLTEGLRTELIQQGSKIRVSCVSPGLVDTDMGQSVITSEDGMFKNYSTIDSSDVADAVVYMLSVPDKVQVQDMIIRPRDPPR